MKFHLVFSLFPAKGLTEDWQPKWHGGKQAACESQSDLRGRIRTATVLRKHKPDLAPEGSLAMTHARLRTQRSCWPRHNLPKRNDLIFMH